MPYKAQTRHTLSHEQYSLTPRFLRRNSVKLIKKLLVDKILICISYYEARK